MIYIADVYVADGQFAIYITDVYGADGRFCDVCH